MTKQLTITPEELRSMAQSGIYRQLSNAAMTVFENGDLSPGEKLIQLSSLSNQCRIAMTRLPTLEHYQKFIDRLNCK